MRWRRGGAVHPRWALFSLRADLFSLRAKHLADVAEPGRIHAQRQHRPRRGTGGSRPWSSPGRWVVIASTSTVTSDDDRRRRGSRRLRIAQGRSAVLALLVMWSMATLTASAAADSGHPQQTPR